MITVVLSAVKHHLDPVSFSSLKWASAALLATIISQFLSALWSFHSKEKAILRLRKENFTSIGTGEKIRQGTSGFIMQLPLWC